MVQTVLASLYTHDLIYAVQSEMVSESNSGNKKKEIRFTAAKENSFSNQDD